MGKTILSFFVEKLARRVYVPYHNYHKKYNRFSKVYLGREEAGVTKTLERIKKLQLSRYELKYYSLSERWKEEIPEKVLERLAKAIEKNKEALKELEKY